MNSSFEPAGFEVLVRCHRAAFQRLARRLADSPEDAEDLLQETLLDAYRSFHRFRSGSHFYGWIARIMKNNQLDRRGAGATRRFLWTPRPRQRSSSCPTRTGIPKAGCSPASWTARRVGPGRAPAGAAGDGRALHVGGASYEEAARAVDCPVGTVRSRLHRAHRYLRELLASLSPAFGEPDPPLASPPVHSRRAFLRLTTAAVAGAALNGMTSGDEARAARAGLRVGVVAGPGQDLAGLRGALAGEGVDVFPFIPGEQSGAWGSRGRTSWC